MFGFTPAIRIQVTGIYQVLKLKILNFLWPWPSCSITQGLVFPIYKMRGEIMISSAVLLKC